ncbi:hypothetical protein KC19_VG184400 [Ceratodon purpureus]|uniref:Uncharacterized protein n=1 Tax=Ceratodon purpureus TaxID=3225 RepID=A0A8T0HSJ9_CERPU|nr:hypothetical protein KC19_VG184400 [Ceratodon purpureus]
MRDRTCSCIAFIALASSAVTQNATQCPFHASH